MAGAALAGGVGAKGQLSRNILEDESWSKGCRFSQLPPGFIYLNNGTEGTMPECVLSTLQENLIQWATHPTTSYELDPILGKRQELNREKVAEFLNVGINNICLTDNTTMGLSMTLMGLNFSSKDKVVTTNHEHPAMRSPLQIIHEKQGVQIKTQSFPAAEKLNKMENSELIDTLFPDSNNLRNAKALCVSHIYPTTGVRLPLRALRDKANELNIPYLIVDGAQALGMVDISKNGDSLENSDFYACPGHKFLNGPPSTGVLYIRNADIRPPEFYPSISQRMIRYSETNKDGTSNYPMAKALQVRGCSNAPGFVAMVRAMNFVEDEGGAPQIEKHILTLSKNVKDFIITRAPGCIISPHLDKKLLSGLTTFFPFRWDKPQNPLKDKHTANLVVEQLLEKNIQVRSIAIPNPIYLNQSPKMSYGIRVSTGYFNTAAEIESFQNVLQEVLMGIS